MPLRVTQASIYQRTLIDIRNSLLGSTRLQQAIASGRRVSRPSDDPAATLRILPLTADLRDLGQLRENVQLARETINTGASSLEEASAMMQRVRELTVQAANATISEGDRRSIGQEVNQLLQQMTSVANSQRAGRYLFGGTISDRAPFEIIDDPSGTRVEYRGNGQELEIEVAPGVTTQLNLPGSEIFQTRARGATTITGSTGAGPGAGFDTGLGQDQLLVTFGGLDTAGVTGIGPGSGTTTAVGVMNYTFTAPDQLSINGQPAVTVTPGQNTVQVGSGELSLDLTLPIAPATGSFTSTAQLSIDGGASSTSVDFSSNDVRVVDSFDGSVLNVDVSGLSLTGQDRVEYKGTFDVFTTLIELRDILENPPAGATQAEVSSQISAFLGRIDSAHDNLLDSLRSMGFRSNSMQLLAGRVESLQTSSAESLSLAQDTEIVEAIVRFNQQNTNYQAALQVGAQVVQLSLLNFL